MIHLRESQNQAARCLLSSGVVVVKQVARAVSVNNGQRFERRRSLRPDERF